MRHYTVCRRCDADWEIECERRFFTNWTWVFAVIVGIGFVLVLLGVL